MKKKFLLPVVSFLAFANAAMAQTSDFKPSGKPIVKVFGDYFYNSQNSKSNTGFEIQRAYLGYGYNFTEKFSGKALLDVGNNTGGSAYTAFLKNALVEYKDNLFTIDAGLIGTDAFSLQESVWGKRYLQKSFQDLNGFSSSADLGASLKVKISPVFSLDASVLNGEGYKSIQADSTLKVTAGLTVQPIKGLTARVYTDYLKNNKNIKPAGKAQTSFNAFLGYVGAKASVGAEYNYQKNSGLTSGKDLTGISVYGTAEVAPKTNVFARFDNLSSKDDVNASAATLGKNDGNLLIAGLEYTLTKGIRVSPNIQLYNPKKDGAKNLTSFYLNFEMGF